MSERKMKSDWRNKCVNEANRKYLKEDILKLFCFSDLGFEGPAELVLPLAEPPVSEARTVLPIENARKEKIPEWYLEENEEKLFDFEENFSKIDVKFEEKIKAFVEEDEKVPEWDTYEEKEEEGEVIVYPLSLLKKHMDEGNPFAGIIFSNSTKNEESLITDPNSIPFEKVWFYKDPQNNTQGPFSTIDMFNWSAAGYFNNSLQIAHSTPAHFFALQMYILQEKYKLLSSTLANN